MNRMIHITAAALAMSVASASLAAPVLQFRLESDHTSSDEAWERTYGMLLKVPELCDELWFGTGFGMPTLDKHRANAARIGRAMQDVKKRLGWDCAIQIQATIGHGAPFVEGKDYSARNWTGWTGSTGYEDKYCNCPRDPRFLKYMREMSRIYAELHPSSVWIDDDLRINSHPLASNGSLDGCWCDRCIKAFNEETGGNWTRVSLEKAARKNAKLRIAYEESSIRAVANVARAIGEEFHAISPETQLSIQNTYWADRTIRAIAGALHDVSGKGVGYRPGGGAYSDVNPNDQIFKALKLAAQRRNCADVKSISLWTSEIACYPRTYGTRSSQITILEAFTALVYGMDAVSALVLNYGREDEDLYFRFRVKPMADAAKTFRSYAKSCEGTDRVGFTGKSSHKNLYHFAQSGVPVLFGPGKSIGKLSKREVSFDRCGVTSAEVQKLRDALDGRAGGSPAVLESPFVGMMLPRVAKDGALRNVALLSLRLDEQGPIKLRLRGVPQNATQAVWHEIRRAPVTLPIQRAGDICYVVVPSLGIWNGGYVDFVADSKISGKLD